MSELKQKVYVCRLCDAIYTDYKAIVIHIVTEFLLQGFTIPTYNLDLSQCITILYIEQLYTEDMLSKSYIFFESFDLKYDYNLLGTINKISGLILDGGPEDIFDEIDKLEAKINGEDEENTKDSDTLEFVIDLDNQPPQELSLIHI